MVDLISRDLIKILFKELLDDVKSALILKAILSPMNGMFTLNFRYDIEINEADFGAPLAIGFTWAVFFYTHLLNRLQFSLILFTARQEFA